MEWKARHEYRSIRLRFASLASSILSDTGVYSAIVQTMDFGVFFLSLSLSLSLPGLRFGQRAPRFIQLCAPSVKGQRRKGMGEERERERDRMKEGWKTQQI